MMQIHSTSDLGNLDLLGTQLLALCLTLIISLVVSWGFFFPMKRLNKLRVEKSVEVIGHDTIMSAKSKGLDLVTLRNKIETLYPEPKKKGC